MKYVQNTFFWVNIHVHSKVSCVRSSHDLCARAHAHTLEGSCLGVYFSPKLLLHIWISIRPIIAYRHFTILRFHLPYGFSFLLHILFLSEFVTRAHVTQWLHWCLWGDTRFWSTRCPDWLFCQQPSGHQHFLYCQVSTLT